MPVDAAVLCVFEGSLNRCSASPNFLDRFYESFLASSPKVREKFAHTDFVHQKQALRASFDTMRAVAAADGNLGRHLEPLAERHSSRDLKIGAELYDLWLDSLLATVKECDPEHTPAVHNAWETVMMVGIRYLLLHY